MRNYCFAKNEASTGPFSLEQLKYHGVLPETKVWYEGLPEWIEAMPELSNPPILVRLEEAGIIGAGRETMHQRWALGINGKTCTSG